MRIINFNSRLAYIGVTLLLMLSLVPSAVSTLWIMGGTPTADGELDDDDNSNNSNNKVLTSRSTTTTITPDASSASSSSSSSTGNASPASKRIKSAFVTPVFTTAAYNSSFYLFYTSHKHEQPNTNVTKHLNLLYSHLTPETYSDPFAMLGLVSDAKKALPNSDVQVISDVDVDKGLIFEKTKNAETNNIGNSPSTGALIGNSSRQQQQEQSYNIKKNAYDLLVLGHQEYVTQREYNNLKQFVANGGKIIFLDGNVFMAEVEYNQHTDTIRLVKGHGWAFNGMSAWKSVWQRWNKETSEWVGSSYFSYSHNIFFQNNPFGYTPHEEQYITNPKDKIILDYHATLVHPGDFANKRIPKHFTIATYELQYQKGKVIVIGLYADDIGWNKSWHAYFQTLLTQHIKNSW